MPALDYGVLSSLLSPPQQNQPQQASTDTSPVDQAQPLPQFNLPPTEAPQTGGPLNFADLPPAMGAVGSHPGRGNNKIQNIILHSSDGTEPSDLNTLTQSHNAGAHFYVTRDGRIFPLVNLDDTAYHAGRVSNPAYSNESTIGIEQEHFDPGKEFPNGQDWPDAQVQSSARLVAALQNRYGLTDQNVLYHSQVAFPAGRKQDPYDYPRDKFDQFVAAAKSGTGGQVAEQQPLTIPPIVYPWQAMNPNSVTFGDVMQQQQQRETSNIAFSSPRANVPAVSTIGSEFGEVDNPARGGYTEPGWNVGKWGDSLAGADNQGVALPQSVLAQYGDTNDNGFASNFNSRYDVQVTNPQSGQSTIASLKDIGPRESTGAGLDMLMGTRSALGLGENFKGPVQYSVVPKGTAGQGNQRIAVGPVNSIQYPWSAQTSAVSQDQINQAIQQSLQRNALASTQTGVPADYQAQAPSQNVGLVLSQAGDVQAKLRPESFGMRVATPDDVKAYDSYLANGGDPSQIDPYDKLSVTLAKNPQALLDPRNAQLLDEMVVQPQKAASAKEPFGQKVWNAANSGFAGIGDMGNSIAALARAGWKDAAPAVRTLAEKMSGQTPDPEALAGTADLAALGAQGVGKTASDVYNLLSQIGLTATNGSLDLASMLTRDPQKLQQLHTQQVNNMQSLARDQQAVADLGSNLQGMMANAYSATGVFADLGQKLKTTQADPQAVEGISQLAQLLGPGALESLAGAELAGVFKPLRAERALEATTDVAEARGRKFFFDSTQAVPRDVEAETANPKYFDIRNAQAQLAPDARAADAAYQEANANLQQQLTSLGKISGDPGTATAFAQTVLNATGNAIGAAGEAMGKLNGLGDRVLNALSLGSPTLRGLYDKMFRAAAYGVTALAGHGWAGRLAEYGVDALEHADAIPKAASGLRDFFKTYGQELAYGETSVPFWTRMSQGTRLVPPHIAAFLDSPAMQTLGSGLKGAPAGMATGAVLGALGDPNDPLSGAISNAIPGGLFGMVGGGFGQWLRYDSPGDVYLRARGDWKRTLDTMAGAQRDQFLSLQPKDQLMLSTYLQAAPGLRVNFEHNPAGPEGSFDPHIHTFDTANKPTITVNLANPEGTVRGIFAHELMHATQSAGMTPDIYDALLGNVDRGTPGQYTALDAKGNPMEVDPATSRYTTNQEFQNFKNDYTTSLARSGQPTAHLSDLDIARELFAEHGVDYLLSAKGAVDATSAFRPAWVNRNMLKNAYAKLGFVFDRQGNLVQGTHLFDNVRPNDAVDKLTQKFFQTQFRERALNSEELPTRKWTMEDLRSTNAADTFLNTAPEIMRNPDGSVMRDSRGMPLMRTPAQVKAYNAKLANDTLDRINALPDERKADVGFRILPNGNIFVRYLPQELRDGLAKTNEYNPHQITALNAFSEQLADNSRMGTNFRMFYHKALSEGKRYGSFAGTEKFAVPYGFEISKHDNILLRSVDFDQLNDNYLRNATRAPFRQLWNNPSEFTQDWNTYFQNHARGEPGATGIGEAKRDAINSLLRLDTSVNRDANPLLGETRKGFPGTRPIIKSYRIDRASQVTPLEMTSPFTTEEQYYRMNRNFRPRKGEGEGFQSVSPEDFIAARNKSKRPEFLSDLKPEDLTEHRLFANADRTVGAAIDPRGDIQNVFNNSGVKGAGAYAVAHAIQNGGRTLDAFAGHLNRFYRQFGFQETGRMKFNDEFAPANWDYAQLGRPDVVFMGLSPTGYPGSRADAIARAQGPEIHWLPNEQSTKYGTDSDRLKDASRIFATGTRDYRLPGEGGRSQAFVPRGQPGAGASGTSGQPVAPDTTAIPVTYRTTRTGSTEEEKIPYGISNAPLVADKQPAANLKANNFEHVDFLTAPEQQKLTHLDKASAVTDFADKIVQDYDRWKGTDWAKEAKGWYRDVRKYLTTAFGGDRERFAHLLAATSSGQGVVQNWKDALEAYQRYRGGHYDDAIREFKRTGQITEDMKPTKANGAKFGRNSDAVLKVLAGTWLDEVEGPKTPNFFRNLFGRGTDATIDMWAARTMRRLGYEGVEGAPEQWRITPPSEGGVSDLDFAFSQQAFKQAADRLGMKAHELQAVMWYAEKHLWAERGWAKGGAQAAKESYVPRLKEFAEQVSAAGGPQSPGYLPRLQRYVQGR